MNDKELLESAAKAAGYPWQYLEGFYEPSSIKPNGFWVDWSPLTNDGDALRLAVKLKMDVILDFDQVIVCFGESDEFVTEYFYDLPKPTDTYAVTRRAIVRAAAAIGDGMKS